jgi:hypothetical protein
MAIDDCACRLTIARGDAESIVSMNPIESIKHQSAIANLNPQSAFYKSAITNPQSAIDVKATVQAA